MKTRGIWIRRTDFTVPMTKEEEKIAKSRNVEEYHIPKLFRARINNAIPPSHKMCHEV